MAKKIVEIYTDGACSGNPGAGGYAAILRYNGSEKVISGGEGVTTNNRMELMAIIKSLSGLKEPCRVSVYSDSAYCVNAFNEGWLTKWKNNGWKATAGTVKNKELWQELLLLCAVHEVKFIKVKGHSDNELNNRCDILAKKEIENLTGQ